MNINEDYGERNNYRDILKELAKEWIYNESHHKVSKRATDEFWRIANKYFHELYMAKGDFGRKIPQFPHLRNQLYDDEVPTVSLEIGYQSKEDGQVTIVEDVTSDPVSRFPTSQYRRIYEIASVKVSNKFRTVIRSTI